MKNLCPNKKLTINEFGMSHHPFSFSLSFLIRADMQHRHRFSSPSWGVNKLRIFFIDSGNSVNSEGWCIQLRCIGGPRCYLFSLSGWHLIIEPLSPGVSDLTTNISRTPDPLPGLARADFRNLEGTGSGKNGNSDSNKSIFRFIDHECHAIDLMFSVTLKVR